VIESVEIVLACPKLKLRSTAPSSDLALTSFQVSSILHL
jgi:hypothetical protein